jgi:hypothetical protein
VRIAVALKFLIQVGMGVEVNQGEIGKVLSEGSQDWIRNRVVATEANRTLSLATALSIARNAPSAVSARSPASNTNSEPRSIPLSVDEFDESQWNASRIRGGASPGPRR